jgi:phosphate transport system permease protein
MEGTVTEVAPALPRGQRFLHLLRDGDHAAYLITLIFAASTLLVAIVLGFELWTRSSVSRGRFGLGFLFSTAWDPVAEQFGALPFLYGTALTAMLALVISIPLGVGAAIFLSELAAPRLAKVCTFLVELLAAVPSVIFGLLAIFTLVPLLREYVEPFLNKTLGFLPWFRGPMYGSGYLAAGLILAVMTFPFIITVSREALLAVPREQREAALALGATQWESTWKVVVPYARLGILGSIFLALARAGGETMAVTMVIGNDPAVHASLFSPGYTITAILANEFLEATGDVHLSALVELGLVLFLLTMILNGAARLLILATTRTGNKRA